MNNTLIVSLSVLLTLFLMSGCGESSSSSGAGASAPIASAGSTGYTGQWYLTARINATVGGTSTSLTQTSDVNVFSNGAVTINSTDTDCTLAMTANGNIFNYQTTCLIATGVTNSTTPCQITFSTQATMQGVTNSGTLAGSFSSETFTCNGASVSYTGNLSGTQTATTTTI